MTNWLLTINIGQYLHNEALSPAEVGNLIADELERATANSYMLNNAAIYRLGDIMEDFRNVGGNKTNALDEMELNNVLDAMYDWGHANRVWFKPVLS